MARIDRDAIATLNALIATCKDGELGFRTSVDDTRDPELKRIFMSYAHERAALAAELQREVLRLGGEPESHGSVSGSLRRGWINLKSAVTGGDDRSIVAAAESGEDAAVAAYERALRDPLPESTRRLVERHYALIRAVHDRVRSLRSAA